MFEEEKINKNSKVKSQKSKAENWQDCLIVKVKTGNAAI